MKFELEQVLTYRRDMEKMHKQEFAFAKQRLESASDLLEQQKNEVSRLTKEFTSKQSELNTIDELNHYIHFFAKKRYDIGQQKEKIQQLDSIMNEKREELLDATKDKKVLETLKEKKTSLHLLHQAQKERNFMDEISIQKNGAK